MFFSKKMDETCSSRSLQDLGTKIKAAQAFIVDAKPKFEIKQRVSEFLGEIFDLAEKNCWVGTRQQMLCLRGYFSHFTTLELNKIMSQANRKVEEARERKQTTKKRKQSASKLLTISFLKKRRPASSP